MSTIKIFLITEYFTALSLLHIYQVSSWIALFHKQEQIENEEWLCSLSKSYEFEFQFWHLLVVLFRVIILPL